jgi:hypothetical protein
MSVDMFPSIVRHHPGVVIALLPVIRLILALGGAHPEVYTKVVLEGKYGDGGHPQSFHVCVHLFQQCLPPIRSQKEEEDSEGGIQDRDTMNCHINNIIATLNSNILHMLISFFHKFVIVLLVPIISYINIHALYHQYICEYILVIFERW